MNIYEIADGVRLLSVQTDRFKTSRITFTMATPLGGNVSAKAILPYLLHRRCRKYPDFTAFNCVLDDLYGAVVSAGVSKQGEGLLLNISITSIDDRFALDGEKIMNKCFELLCDMIFEPIIKDGKMFGRGTLDMKSFAAVAMNSMEYAGLHNLPLKFGVVLSFNFILLS